MVDEDGNLVGIREDSGGKIRRRAAPGAVRSGGKPLQRRLPEVVRNNALRCSARPSLREHTTNMNDWYGISATPSQLALPDHDARYANAADCEYMCGETSRKEWCVTFEFSPFDNGSCKLYECKPEGSTSGRSQ